MSTGRVEVSECNSSPLFVRVAEIFQDLFSHDLGSTVARFGLERRSFGDGNFGRSSVNSSGRRVDHVEDLVLLHDLLGIPSQ